MSCVPSAMGGMASGVRVVVLVSRRSCRTLNVGFPTVTHQRKTTSLVLLVFRRHFSSDFLIRLSPDIHRSYHRAMPVSESRHSTHTQGL